MRGQTDSRREDSSTVRPGSIVPGTDYPVLDATGSPACTILAGRYADIPTVVGITLIIATPFFGGSPGWTFFAAAILAATLLIAFILHTGNLR